MDKIYISDEISTDYKYAQFGSNYIDLYNSSELLPNNTYNYYRVYFYDNQFIYSQGVNTRGNYSSVLYLSEVPVTQDFHYRRDYNNILTMLLIFIVMGMWLLNLITSGFRKGGIFHGLL